MATNVSMKTHYCERVTKEDLGKEITLDVKKKFGF